jgi:hypothetical protein
VLVIMVMTVMKLMKKKDVRGSKRKKFKFKSKVRGPPAFTAAAGTQQQSLGSENGEKDHVLCCGRAASIHWEFVGQGLRG